MIIVCKDCQKRYPGCHAGCEWYKAELRATHEENKRREHEMTIPEYSSKQQLELR